MYNVIILSCPEGKLMNNIFQCEREHFYLEVPLVSIVMGDNGLELSVTHIQNVMEPKYVMILKQF